MKAHVAFNLFGSPVRIGLNDLLKFMNVVAQVPTQGDIEVDLRFGR